MNKEEMVRALGPDTKGFVAIKVDAAGNFRVHIENLSLYEVALAHVLLSNAASDISRGKSPDGKSN